jgi:hypothetical protein
LADSLSKSAPDGPPILNTHSPCGAAVVQRTECEGCGQVHDPAEVGVRPGPGMPATLAARLRGAAAASSAGPTVR